MTYPTWQPPQTYAPPAPPRRKRWPWIATAAVVVVLAAGVGGYLLFGTTTFTLHGSVSIANITESGVPAGGVCYTTGTNAGDQIVVSASNGDRLAIGMLGQGVSDGGTAGLPAYDCVFKFDVAGIPSGRGPYSVSIGSHPGPVFTEDEAADLKLSLNG